LDQVEAEIREVSPESAVGRSCLASYFRELSERFEGGCDLDDADPSIREEMTPPRGFFLVASLGDRPAGCVGLKRLDESTGELKRMWTAPAARGRGIARRLLREVEARARQAGFERVRLDTNRVLAEAHAFYRSEGFIEIARYNANPYAHHWFEKLLC
jgi:GNAT superfamily N-acetyltransferase